MTVSVLFRCFLRRLALTGDQVMTCNVDRFPTTFLNERALAGSSHSDHGDDYIVFAGIRY
jgi:hypothetical protein